MIATPLMKSKRLACIASAPRSSEAILQLGSARLGRVNTLAHDFDTQGWVSRGPNLCLITSFVHVQLQSNDIAWLAATVGTSGMARNLIKLQGSAFLICRRSTARSRNATPPCTRRALRSQKRFTVDAHILPSNKDFLDAILAVVVGRVRASRVRTVVAGFVISRM